MWLGSKKIQSSENRIAIPSQVIELKIVEPELPVHWMLVKSSDKVAISKQAINNGGAKADARHNELDLRRVTHTTVGKNRVTTIPKRFFPDFEGKSQGSRPVPAKYQFNRNSKCHFITSRQLWGTTSCLIIQDGIEITEIMEGDSDSLLTDGGDPDNDPVPESEIDCDQVYILETGEIVDIESAKSILEASGSPQANESSAPDAKESNFESENSKQSSTVDFEPDIIVEARDCILGRVASRVAELALEGENVAVVNVGQSVITGQDEDIIETDHMKGRNEDHQDPHYPQRPDRIFKRSVRDMLPYKHEQGRIAFEKVRVFVDNPFGDVEAEVLEGTTLDRLSIQFVQLSELVNNLDSETETGSSGR